MKGKVKYRIGIIGAIVMGVVAITLDIVSLFPFVGTAAGPIFWIIAGVYLWKVGISLIDGKRLAVMGADMVIKMIPFLQEIPVELLIGWLAIFFMTRIEDRIGISLSPVKKIGVTLPRSQRQPVNSQEGRREPRNIIQLNQQDSGELDMAA